MLDPQCVFLNHGSFGATPRVVLQAQDQWRERMERQPVHFVNKILPGALRQAASELGAFLHVRGQDIVFVENATAGINAVLRSIRWQPGDEILYTTHGYGAVNKTIEYICDRAGARPVKVAVPFPIDDAAPVVSAIEAGLSPRTRLAVIDHITSPTALVLPVEKLTALCHDQGVRVLVDGAHAPGMLPLDVQAIGADYYAGNCHKWLFACKGCGFLWADPQVQADLHPTVISWGWPDGFTQEFDWTGTRDFSAWLAISAALAFHATIPPDVRWSYNNDLAQWAACTMERRWDVQPTAPSRLRASMATVAIPGTDRSGRANGDRLHDILIREHEIEVPIIDFGEKLWVRVSAQVYNAPDEYERLIAAMPAAVDRLNRGPLETSP